MRFQRFRDTAGFSLIEVLVVAGVASVVMATAVLIMPGAVRDARSDGAMTVVASELRRAKDLAVTERRDMEVRFVAPNEIQIWRQEIPLTAGMTKISSVHLENNMQFVLMPGLPDTPDGFGNGSAIEFDDAPALFFRTEGIFTDANANLDSLNGTVFLGVPNQPLTARAVTVFGPTALIRSFRWTGQQWFE
ncbi:MAG: prepilin-type N-terminal cleavage/methylation domain-containing protein [Acidobacteria bacterium]|nr:prepilin-type N-terminal cleavage/methylation domain-containing protein [Acidobacteriota bacterium]